ncbi:hypothetical protein MNBD_GAMMA13-1948 [hydrothermal vent metagenome]|uniref:ParD protein (Antitoxin to ParE) n=1 Tax=hydrothermal vent metagenome TaxID=652676 RepID=A0A3B0Z0D5_9ZZZZ
MECISMSNIDIIRHVAYIYLMEVPIMNVSLSSTFEAYIQKQLDEGTYNNASEIVREALRLKMQQDEIYQARLESLRTAIIQGEKSGDSISFDMRDIIQEAKKDAGLNA